MHTATGTRALALLTMIIIAVGAVGCGSSTESNIPAPDSPLSQPLTLPDPVAESGIAGEDWVEADGEAWFDFSEAYDESFVGGCIRIFEESPNGVLYGGDGSEYTPADCTEFAGRDAIEASEIPTSIPDYPSEEGSRIGFLDGCLRYLDWAGLDLHDGDFVVDTETCYNQ